MSLTISCSHHPKYTGKKPPPASCDSCYRVWKVREQCEIERLKVKP